MTFDQLLDHLLFQMGKVDKIEELVKQGLEHKLPPSQVLKEILNVVDSGRSLEKVKYYLVAVEGGIEPQVRGPYDNEDLRDSIAQAVHADQDEWGDSLFRANVRPNGELTVETYSAGFFMEEEEDNGG